MEVLIANVISTEPSVWMGGLMIASASSDWGSYKKISFTVPQLGKPICEACGRVCQCVANIDIHDSAAQTTNSIRKVSLQLIYTSPVLGPPVILAFSPGCLKKPCTTGSVVVGRSVEVTVTLGNFPMIPSSFKECFTAGMACLTKAGHVSPIKASASRGKMISIAVLSSTVLETKLLLTYIAPESVPIGGLVDMFISHGVLPSVHLYLPVIRSRFPAVLSVFPTSITRQEAATRAVTIKMSDWIPGINASAFANCDVGGPRAAVPVKVVGMDRSGQSAELSFLFPTPTLLTECRYAIDLRLSNQADFWNLRLYVDVQETCILSSISPSVTSVSGGQTMKVFLKGFPLITDASDVQVLFFNPTDSVSRPASNVSLGSSDGKGFCMS